MKIFAYVGLGLSALFVIGEGYSQYQSATMNAQDSLSLAQAQTATLLGQREDLLRQQAEANLAKTTAPTLWAAAGNEAPTGELQSALAVLAQKAGTDLKSIHTEEPHLIGAIDAVRLTLEVEADMAAWQVLMRDFHQNTPVILPVSSEIRRLNRTDPAATYPKALLRVTLDFPYIKEGAL